MAGFNQYKDGSSVFETIKVLALSIVTKNSGNVNLLDIFMGINLFESIFENFITGRLYISDTFDLYKNQSLSGNEDILLTLQERSTGIKYDFTFKLYKINRESDVTKAITKLRHLECYFYSAEMQTDSLKRISRKFYDYPENIVESVVRDIYGSSKDLFTDTGDDIIEYYSNFHKGSSVIDYVVNNSTSIGGERDFVFYETMQGFHFIPISYLLTLDSVEDLVWEPKREKTFRIDDIHFYKQDAYFDINTDSNQGLFGKTLYKMSDWDRYGIVKTAATYADNSDNFTTSGRNLLFSDDLFNSNNIVKDYWHNHEVAQVRSASLSTIFNNNRLMVRVQGTLDRKCGDVLKVSYPNQDNFPEPNTSLDGSWMILSIAHIISNSSEYTQNMIIAKNARNTDDNLPAAGGTISL